MGRTLENRELQNFETHWFAGAPQNEGLNAAFRASFLMEGDASAHPRFPHDMVIEPRAFSLQPTNTLSDTISITAPRDGDFMPTTNGHQALRHPICITRLEEG